MVDRPKMHVPALASKKMMVTRAFTQSMLTIIRAVVEVLVTGGGGYPATLLAAVGGIYFDDLTLVEFQNLC
jgi:hypothetical protein